MHRRTGSRQLLHSCNASTSSDTSSDTDSQNPQRAQKATFNEFLSVCNIEKVNVYKKKWQDASLRTRGSRISKAKESIVATLSVIAPGDAGPLWEALKASQLIETALGTSKESEADKSYLEALAQTYDNESTWGARRQILSVMADLTTFKRMQVYFTDLTEFRFKEARKHKIQHGRGVPLPLKKSPRLRVSPEQLDHFLTFITSPPVIQDLPFG